MENSTEVLKAVMSGNAALLNEILQSLNSTERISVLAAQDHTDEALREKNVIRIPCKTTPLIVAVQTGNLDCVKVLLNYKADIEEQGESLRYRDRCDSFPYMYYTGPPLFVAAANGNLDILSYLVEQGANVNASSSSGRYTCPPFDNIFQYTPLIVALRNGHIDAFTFLTDKGADVNLQDHQGYAALHYAVESENFDAVSCLVYNGAVVNLQCRNGQSALHFASSDICQCLIQNQADIDVRDSRYCTPLMKASCNNDVKKVAMLIENGAEVDLQDVDGNTALHHAVLNSYDSLDIEYTPCCHLHRAVLNSYDSLHIEYTPDICLALLTTKASIDLCNSQGWTPLLLASKKCMESVVEILLKQPEVTKEQRANALELLGASTCLMGVFNPYIEKGFSYIKRGMKERFADASHLLLKQQVEPAEAYQNRRECQTLEELAEIEGDEDAIIMESLVIRERIIGANNVELLKPIQCVANHFNRMDPGSFKTIPLYRYAIKIAQGCIEECFSSAVICLHSLTQLLFNCKQYSDKELLLELLELTVFLYENLPDSDEDYDFYEAKESVFDSTERLIRVIAKAFQNSEEDETYSHILVLLKKLLHHNPRYGTLLHCTQDFINTDILPSADSVKLLLKAGFNVHAIDKDGNTPLHRAASLEPGDDLIHLLTEIMKALVDGGAHHDFVNHYGETPMDMAKTDEACMILSEEKSKLELKCISARAVKKFGIPYLGEVPKILEKYISMH